MPYGLFLAIALIVIRIVALPTIPFRVFSPDTAVLIGVFIYFVLPLSAASEQLAAEPLEYCFQIVAAYIMFLVGSMVARKIALRKLKKLSSSRALLAGPQKHLYATICLLLASFLVWKIYAAGGISQMIDSWTYGNIHRASLDLTEQLENDVKMTAFAAVVFQIVFVLLWTVTFLRNRALGMLLWAIYLAATLTEYVGRSAIFSLLLVPYIVFAEQSRLRLRTIALHTVPIVIGGLIFGSWMSWFRLDTSYQLSMGRVMEDTVRDVAGPMKAATIVLEDPAYRSSAYSYIVSYPAFFIPRALWQDKPGDELNITLTRMLTGRSISRANSVITFTILGEGWFYFGSAGGIILMTFFGFISTLLSHYLSRSPVLTGAHALVIMQTLVEMRSTLLYYVQYSIVLMALSYLMLQIARRMTPRKRPRYPESLRVYATFQRTDHFQDVAAPQ